LGRRARVQFAVCYLVLLEGVSLPRSWAGLCSQGWLVEFCVVCGTHLFVLSNDAQADLRLVVAVVVVVVVVAAVRNGSKFSQCNME
jgi:hypothetical protein